jgi:photosystem II stability/assembly factor-like uncharacterized protein
MKTISLKLKVMAVLFLLSGILQMQDSVAQVPEPTWHQVGEKIDIHSNPLGYPENSVMLTPLNLPYIAYKGKLSTLSLDGWQSAPAANMRVYGNRPVWSPMVQPDLQDETRAYVGFQTSLHSNAGLDPGVSLYIRNYNPATGLFDTIGDERVGRTSLAVQKSYSFVTLPDGSVYVAFLEYVEHGEYRTTVKMFDGANWIVLGDPQFSPNGERLDIQLMADGTPVFGYWSYGDGEELPGYYLFSFDQDLNTWVEFTTPPIAPVDRFERMDVGPDGSLFLVSSYQNNDRDIFFIVHKWDEALESWEDMGGFAKSTYGVGNVLIRDMSLFVKSDNDGNPVVMYINDGDDSHYGYSKVVKHNPDSDQWEYMLHCDDLGNCDSRINDDSHIIGPGKIHDIDFDAFNNPWIIVHTGNDGQSEYTQQIMRWGCESLDFVAPELHSPLDASGPYGFNSLPLVWNQTPENCYNQIPDTYHIQVATDAGFVNITHSATPLNPGDFQIINDRWIYRANDLAPNTTYFWRVKPDGSPNWSDVWSFTTDDVVDGANWEHVDPPVPDVHLKSVLALSANHFYVGTDDGRVFYTTNGGANYMQADLSPLINTPINDISLFSDNRMAIATGNGVQIADIEDDGTYNQFNQSGINISSVNNLYFNWEADAGFAVHSNSSIGKFALNNDSWDWTSQGLGLQLEPHAIGFRRAAEHSMGYVVGDALDLGFLPRTGLFRTTDLGLTYTSFGQQDAEPTITGLGDFPVNFYDLAVTMEPGLERWIAIGSKESIYAAIPNPEDFFQGDIVGQDWVSLDHAGRNEALSFRAAELYHIGGADNQHTGIIVGDEGKIIRIRYDEATETWDSAQMGWDVSHGLWDVHITGNYDGNWQPNGQQFAYVVGDHGTIRKFELEEPQGIAFNCEENVVIDSPFPSFNWGVIGGAPDDYTVELTQDGNLILNENTPNNFFLVSGERLKHQHEYTLSIKANYEGRSGAPVSCNFTINDPVLYVNKALGAGVGDGTSWMSAYRELTSALDVLVDGQQVWVAAGTYTPQPSAAPGAVDRTLSFHIDGLHDVDVLGGFAGFEALEDQRNPENNETILSGDLLRNDVDGDFDSRAENSYRVFSIQNTDESVNIDGFTITKGTTDRDIANLDKGAGVYLKNSHAIVSNLKIMDNYAQFTGAGMQIDGSFDGIQGVTFESMPTLESVHFLNNETEHWTSGSALSTLYSNPVINRSLFHENTGNDAIILLDHYSSATIVNSIIANSTNTNHIHIPSQNMEHYVTSINNTFSGAGTGIRSGLAGVNVYNTIFDTGFSIIYGAGATVNVANSYFRFQLPDGAIDLGGNLFNGDNLLFNTFINEDDIPFGLALNPCSNAINRGNSDFYPDALTLFDFEGNLRVFDVIDMGAFEYQADIGDCVAWQIDVLVEEDVQGLTASGNTRGLTLGVSENATNEYDTDLDQLAPPLPPDGVFDVRLTNGNPPVHYFKDFRPVSEESTEWNIDLVSSTQSNGTVLSWNPSTLEHIPGAVFLEYGISFITSVDMKTESTVYLPTSINSVKIRHLPAEDTEVQLNYPSGWNLVSVPATPEDNSAESFFPSMEPDTFYGFNNVYTNESVFTAGRGYWVQLNEAQDTTLTENLVEEVSLSLNEGWNLTGSVAREIFTSEILDPEFILFMSSIFEYDPESGYMTASSIMPGKGYWMRAMTAGTVTLGGISTDTGTAGLLSSEPDYSSFHTLAVQNIEGEPRSFYFAGEITEDMPEAPYAYELPPIPPIGVFDVRFEEHTWLTEARETALLVQSPGETITLKYEASETEPEQVLKLIIHHQGGIIEEYQLWPGDSVTVNAFDITKIDVSLNTTVDIPGAGNELPQTVELSQNYPNPFNPTTNITYALPESSSVRLDVYNIMGQRVATLVNDQKPAGYYTSTFDAAHLASGTYIYRLQSGNTVITKKLLLVK